MWLGFDRWCGCARSRLGCPIATDRLSFVFSVGFASDYGVAPDADLHLLWLRRAAGLNLTLSCFVLGEWFWRGQYGLSDESVGAASFWLKRAVAVGGNSSYPDWATNWLNGTWNRSFHAALQQLSATELQAQEQV